MKRKLRRHRVLCTCTFLWVCFIWSNSLRSASESGEASGGVAALINRILELLSIGSVSEHFVRKAAHFSEFAVLGLLLALSLLPLNLRFKGILAVAASLSVACVDELLQILSEGRSCELLDVIIDISGAVLGILAVFWVFWSKNQSVGFQDDKQIIPQSLSGL